jgi:hypothetical protein
MIAPEPMRAQSAADYLVSHGKGGAFGRFLAEEPLDLSRGERVVVRTSRGLELGVVLCRARGGHSRALEHIPAGQLLRRVTGEDEQTIARSQALAQLVFSDSRRLCAELDLPLEILDVEVLADCSKAILHYLNSTACNAEPMLAALARNHGISVLLENLTMPAVVDASDGGCGKPDCGRGEGGCSSCGSGGCSSCGSDGVDLRPYFAHLRGQMEEQRRRPLL